MTIQELLNSGANVCISVTPLQLKEFALNIIDEVRRLQEESANAKADELLTMDEVAQITGRAKNALWRWNRDGYLTSHKVGSRPMYKRSDVDALMRGGRAL